KLGKIWVIVITNAFKIEINEPDVQVVIHVEFPISMSNNSVLSEEEPEALNYINLSDVKNK
ncbi:14710_t:CDS:2, partial [Funneliformis caledonium]